jgi:hypothetical protein
LAALGSLFDASDQQQFFCLLSPMTPFNRAEACNSSTGVALYMKLAFSFLNW